MADSRGGVLWRYEPGSGTLERVTSNGEPRDLAAVGDKVYVGADGRFLEGIVSRYDARSGVREEGLDLLACAMASGEGLLWAAGCLFVERLSTDNGRCARRGVPPPGSVDGRKHVGQFRELAVGGGPCGRSATRSTDVCGGSTPAAVTSRQPSSSASASTSVAAANNRVWITDGVRDRVARGRHRGEAARGGARRARTERDRRRGRLDLVANTLDGTVSRIDPESSRS